MKIIIGKVVKKAKSCAETCPTCKRTLNFVMNLEQEMNYMEFEKKILIPLESMSATLYKCSQCNKYYLELEEDDYDYFILREVRVIDDGQDTINIKKKGGDLWESN